MKMLTILLIALLTFSVAAVEIDCTTKTVNQRTNGNPTVTWCGAVEVPNAQDNGIKYRKVPRKCNKFKVEFFSIRPDDEPKWTGYCDKLRTEGCYVVRIHDDATRMGMMGLNSHIVVKSVNDLPTRFTLNARGLGRNRGIGAGRLFSMDLNCWVH